MLRLILLILLVAAVLIAIAAMVGTIQAMTLPPTATQEDRMPATFQKIAYAVLILLMLGVSAGWLGAA
ncbi:hypothetical protein [Yoonia sp.]|uniref:hypothetical protein n=1 Tax=Yoonia sp. TaxID=2212373 RepID=UPI003F6A8FA5